MRRALLDVRMPKLLSMPSDRERSTMTACLHARCCNLSIIVATAHLESGAQLSHLRQLQLRQVRLAIADESVDATILAADCNLYDEMDSYPHIGEDAWALAGKPTSARWAWPASHSRADSTLTAATCAQVPRRFDRIYVQSY